MPMSANPAASWSSDIADLDARTHPVINTPYEEPRRHWVLDAHGRSTPGQDTSLQKERVYMIRATRHYFYNKSYVLICRPAR